MSIEQFCSFHLSICCGCVWIYVSFLHRIQALSITEMKNIAYNIWKFTFIFVHGEQTGEICTQCAINIIKNLIGIYERIFRTGPHLLQHYALNTSLALHLLCVNRRALDYCTIWNSIIQIDCNHKNDRSSGKPTGKIHNTKHRWKALMKCYAQWALLIYYINIILSFWRCSFAVWVQLWRKKRRGNNFV